MSRHQSRRLSWAGRLLLITTVLFLMGTVPTPLYVVSPGSAHDAAEFVEVPGHDDQTKGSFMLTTISIRPATVLLALISLPNRNSTLRHSREFLPGDMDWEDYLERSRRMMAESQAAAKVAALKSLGYPASLVGRGARIVGLSPDSPAEGSLEPGDVIVAAQGQEIQFADDLIRVLSGVKPGTAVLLTIVRGGQRSEVSVVAVQHPRQQERAALLVTVETDAVEADIPIPVEIRAHDVSGPSAGLIFSLEIVDRLSDSDLAGGRRIAGTGTIDARGNVGAVGGVAQKVVAAEAAGAELFFVPLEQEREATSAARRLTVVPVSTLRQAIDYLDGSV